MSHIAPPSSRRRRVELLLGVVLASVGVLVAVLAFVALNHPKGRQADRASVGVSSSASAATTKKSTPATTSPKPTTSTTAAAPTDPATATKPTVNRPSVIVLNNSGTDGLGGIAVTRLVQGGWTATDGGVFSGDILSTAAYYDPNAAGAQSAATALQAQFPQIKRIKPRFDGLPEGPIVLVLTSDYS
ncbi:LytR C-terminal domain-containing protein [Jatrophihabitans sp. DSM 45814]